MYVLYGGRYMSCALCEMYVTKHIIRSIVVQSCGNCPVALYSGVDGCYKTPWDEFIYDTHPNTKERNPAIIAELRFLEQLSAPPEYMDRWLPLPLLGYSKEWRKKQQQQ